MRAGEAGAAQRETAMADPDALILAGGDGERLRRAQRGFLQLALLVGCADPGIIEAGDMASLMMILHDEMNGAVAGAIPPAGLRH